MILFIIYLNGLLLLPSVSGDGDIVEECTDPNAPTHPSPPGLYTPHNQPFTPIPSQVRRTVCICPWTELPVLKAFRQRGWEVIELEEDKSGNGDPVYLECHQKGQAALIWTKTRLPDWWQAQPWQRHNWIPTQNFMTHKGHFQRALLDHERKLGRKMPFIPDTYLLPADRERLLRRLQPLTKDNPEGGGDNEPWVIKLSATDVSTYSYMYTVVIINWTCIAFLCLTCIVHLS